MHRYFAAACGRGGRTVQVVCLFFRVEVSQVVLVEGDETLSPLYGTCSACTLNCVEIKSMLCASVVSLSIIPSGHFWYRNNVCGIAI
jgi:hypothetical protein